MVCCHAPVNHLRGADRLPSGASCTLLKRAGLGWVYHKSLHTIYIHASFLS